MKWRRKTRVEATAAAAVVVAVTAAAVAVGMASVRVPQVFGVVAFLACEKSEMGLRWSGSLRLHFSSSEVNPKNSETRLYSSLLPKPMFPLNQIVSLYQLNIVGNLLSSVEIR